ncbi:MAG TPA: histidinol-phosphate transaminase [Cyclobacteriaceae bacterium]|nr:histidinol-phosphate transaminase [Cyclobacteriaceae bacterium]
MKFDINAITRKNVRELKPYNTARDDFKGVASVYLDANENPFPTEYNRYPDPKQNALKNEISKLKQIDPLQIILGNGSDEIIDLLIRAFCEPGIDNVIIPQPTYGMYSVCAAINNVEVRLPNLSLDFDLDIQNINAYMDDKSKIIFLCSPNNPSGNLLEQDKIKSLLQSFTGIVVLDEAYIDFADNDGWLTSLIDYPNLFLLQTFSKAWGLAGLRLGVGFGSKEIIQILHKIKPPYNINSITQNIALAAVKEGNSTMEWLDTLKNERKILEGLLKQFSFVEKVYPSQTNFLLVKMINAKACHQHLLTKGIIVRDRSSAIHCDNCLRITVGTPNENKELINTLNDFQNINL